MACGDYDVPASGTFPFEAWATDFYGACYGSAEGAVLTASRALEILEELR